MQIRQISIKIETLRVYGHIPPMVPEKGIKFVKFKKKLKGGPTVVISRTSYKLHLLEVILS